MGTKQKSAACVNCRQMKLKCDASKSSLASCSRCAKQGQICSVDRSFKRVTKRGRLDAVERELRELKARLKSTSNPNQTQSPTSQDDLPREQLSDRDQDGLVRSPELLLQPDLEMGIPQSTSKVLGDIVLDPRSISILLEEYYLHYHDQFSVAPELADLVKKSDESRVLFWTVITIASKGVPAYRSLYDSLVREVRSLLSSVALPSEQSLSLIQALLLVCYWPFPMNATVHDNTWTYCGLATTYALSQGLHRSSNPSDFCYGARIDEAAMRERKRTWYACFIVNQKLSAIYGFPCMFKADHSILETLDTKPLWLPDCIFFQLQISYQVHKFINILGDHDQTSTGLLPNPASIIRMFQGELQLKDTHLTSRGRRHDYIYFLAAKLQLYSFALSDDADNPGRLDGKGNHLEFLSDAFETSMSLLQSGLQLAEELPYWPMHQKRYMVYAVFFLLRLIGRFHGSVDEIAARNLIKQIWELFRQSSEAEDHMSRACDIIEYLSCNEINFGISESSRVRSRMAANLSCEALWGARDRFSATVKAQRPPDYTSAAATERLFLELEGQFPPQFVDSLSGIFGPNLSV